MNLNLRHLNSMGVNLGVNLKHTKFWRKKNAADVNIFLSYGIWTKNDKGFTRQY